MKSFCSFYENGYLGLVSTEAHLGFSFHVRLKCFFTVCSSCVHSSWDPLPPMTAVCAPVYLLPSCFTSSCLQICHYSVCRVLVSTRILQTPGGQGPCRLSLALCGLCAQPAVWWLGWPPVYFSSITFRNHFESKVWRAMYENHLVSMACLPTKTRKSYSLKGLWKPALLTYCADPRMTQRPDPGESLVTHFPGAEG